MDKHFRRMLLGRLKGVDLTSVQIWPKAALPSCHPSQWQMHSSTMCDGPAHSPVAAGEQSRMHSCVGTLQWASKFPQKCTFPWQGTWIPM